MRAPFRRRPAAADSDTDPGAAGRKRGRKAPWWELPVLIVVAVLVAVLVKNFVVQPFFIPSGSMETTLHGCPGCNGDRILVNKPVYSVVRDPEPGDIVVFRAPPGWENEALASGPPTNPVLRALRRAGQLIGLVAPDGEQDIVKRVIAVGGQTVKCCDAQGNVQVGDDGPDGAFRSLADSSYVYDGPGGTAAGSLAFGPVTVPAGRLWVMGDHRSDSEDSRYHCSSATPAPGTTVCDDGSDATAQAGTVPVADVVGKAVLIVWPPSRWATLGTPETFDAQSAAASGSPLTAFAPLGVGLLAAGTVRVGRVRRRRVRSRPAGNRPVRGRASPGAPPARPPRRGP